MPNQNKRLSEIIVGNPIYLLSAMVMMYAITVLLRNDSAPGDIRQILLTYGSLQLYESAIIALAIWITVRLVVPDDAATLLILESLLIGAAFITLDECLVAKTRWGYGLYAAGLLLAAVKLALAGRPLDLAITRTLRVVVWAAFALPVAWIHSMKVAANVQQSADWIACLAWWSFAGLILLGTVAVWLNRARRAQLRSIAPSVVLVVASVLVVGGHLFALHHSFLATPQVHYIAPAFTAASFTLVLAVFTTGRPVNRWTFLLSWVPCFGLALPFVDAPQGAVRLFVGLLGAELGAVYGCLWVMTRRNWFALHLCVLPALIFADQRRQITQHLIAHRGWWLAALAFLLLAAGAALTLHKHRQRMLAAQIHGG